jgi:outer membrane protein TolC
MRWKRAVAGLALTVAGIVGCKQTCFLTECDYNHYKDIVGEMPRLECDPGAAITPTRAAMPTPSTVDDPDRKLRFLTLHEAIALALENGTVGITGVFRENSFGQANENPLSFTGRTVVGSDSIRALALDSAIIASDIEASLSKFDAIWNTSMTWTTTDQPTQGLNRFNNGQTAAFSTELLKPLPTGGVAGITLSTQYQDLTNPPSTTSFNVLNPSYTPRLQFQFEQPLLQGYGVEINQLRATHPGSVLTPFPTGGRVEGILITRLRFDQQRAQFEQSLNFMLVNVEVAYWNLYYAYWNLYSQEAALKFAYEAWKVNKLKIEAGSVATQDLAQARQQYESFRAQRLQALGNGQLGANNGVLENERQLRSLLGLPGEDGTRLIPIDTPTLTPYRPDWNTAVNEALTLRPDLILARQDLKFRQLDLINVRNTLLPDLRFISTYDLNGIGTHLDGHDNNALRSLAADRFNDWTLGLRLTMPLGYRDAHAQLRQARLNLARSYLVLQNEEAKAQRELERQYRNLIELHHLIEIQRSQRIAAGEQLNARAQRYVAGKETLDIFLESQRVFATSLQQEYQAIRDYNNSLAGFEFVKGTLLQRDNVVIAEGPLPHCAQVRAVEHERERAVGLVKRERANPVGQFPCDNKGSCSLAPELPAKDAAPLMALPVESMLQDKPPLPDIAPKTGTAKTADKPASPDASNTAGNLKTGGLFKRAVNNPPGLGAPISARPDASSAPPRGPALTAPATLPPPSAAVSEGVLLMEAPTEKR